MTTIQQQLSAPFPPEAVKFRAGAHNGRKGRNGEKDVPATRALAFAYIDSRDVQKRLDSIFGLTGWWDEYTVISSGQVECALTLVIDGQPITRRDAGIGDDSKAAYSDALKRAAVKFGIGRYLYELPDKWVPCEQRGKAIYLKEIPGLPAWALPSLESRISQNKQSADVRVQTPAEQPATYTEPSPELKPASHISSPPASAGVEMPSVGMKRRFHALGTRLYGKQWDEERAKLVESLGLTSSKQLTAKQMQTIINDFGRRTTASQAAARQAVDDINVTLGLGQ